MYYNEKTLFHDKDLHTYLNMTKEQIRTSIQTEKEDYILNVGHEQFIDYLVERYTISTIHILEDGIYAEEKEENVPSDQLQRHFYYGSGSQTVPVLYYTIAFEGDKEMFNYRPSTFYSVIPRAYVEQNGIIKRIPVYGNDYKRSEAEFLSFKNNLVSHIENINKDLEPFNSSLRGFINSIYESRKEELLSRRKIKSGLSIPIKKKTDMSQTFSIPNIQVKKKITVKPTKTESEFLPDPTLDDVTYNDILKIINDMGKEFERKPSVYGNKGEEDLRDHFLMLLEPHFDGSATGETFNKSGKTDILLRYDGGNVFVGECKFWTGAKGFLGTIDQLLGYLTWRDSKTSVIMFVRNKDFTNVIQTAKESIQSHDNFIKFVEQKDESWFNYIFHLNGDKNKEIKVAVMLYHIPS